MLIKTRGPSGKSSGSRLGVGTPDVVASFLRIPQRPLHTSSPLELCKIVHDLYSASSWPRVHDLLHDFFDVLISGSFLHAHPSVHTLHHRLLLLRLLLIAHRLLYRLNSSAMAVGVELSMDIGRNRLSPTILGSEVMDILLID